MQQKRAGFYHSLIILPDRLYPFKTEIEGHWVRGIRSYNARLESYQQEYGLGHFGYRLGAYRQVFHLIGSILFLVVAAYLSQTFFRRDDAIYVFLAAAVLFISFQEFYLHRRMYQQLWRKGFLDWTVWCIPFGVYFLMHIR